MTKALFFFRPKFWLSLLKIAALVFVSGLILVQIPELLYDLSSTKPVDISGPDELQSKNLSQTVFASVRGRPDFEKAFVYNRYGLSYTYFNLKPYGLSIVVRTYEPVTEEWKQLNRFLGKLRPFERQPFHYRIRDIYRDRFQATIPEDAFFLALDDVPRANGWQIGALIFACALWGVMGYMFYFYPWRR